MRKYVDNNKECFGKMWSEQYEVAGVGGVICTSAPCYTDWEDTKSSALVLECLAKAYSCPISCLPSSPEAM